MKAELSKYFGLICGLCLCLTLSLLPASGQAQSWLNSEQAFLQTLDKITARIATVEVSLNQPLRFGTLRLS